MVKSTSKIQWTDETWNPTIGCTRVSAGCDKCYAFASHDRRHIAWKRGHWPDAPAQYHLPFSRVQLLPERLDDPLHWRAPRRVFVDSMADLFHLDVPDDYLAQVWAMMAMTPQHTYQILTKRPERMRLWVNHADQTEIRVLGTKRLEALHSKALRERLRQGLSRVWCWPLPNVHLGTSVEDQAAAALRIPDLLATEAAGRFLSCEPLLGPLDLSPLALRLPGYAPAHAADFRHLMPLPRGLHWIIIGGESGPHARPIDLAWVRSLVGQCRAAGLAVFVKQLGSAWAHEKKGRHLHGGDPAQWPEDLRIREWPETARKAG